MFFVLLHFDYPNSISNIPIWKKNAVLTVLPDTLSSSAP